MQKSFKSFHWRNQEKTFDNNPKEKEDTAQKTEDKKHIIECYESNAKLIRPNKGQQILKNC